MCGRSVKLFKGLVSLCATALLCAIAAISPVSVQAAASYEWKNAQIVGGERNASALEQIFIEMVCASHEVSLDSKDVIRRLRWYRQRSY